MKKFTIYAVVFNAQGVSVTAFSRAENPTIVELDVDGDVEQQLIGHLMSMPELTFDTPEVVEALALVASSGAIKGAKVSGITNGIKFYLAQRDELDFMSGTNHCSFTVTSGVVVPVSLTLGQGQAASLSMAVHPQSSTGSNPITFSAGASLPTMPTKDTMHTLGDVSLNGTTLSGVQGATVTFGMNVTKQGGDGSTFPKIAFVDSYKPRVEVRTTDATIENTLAPGSVPLSGDGLEVFIREVPLDGMPTAAGTASHAKLQMVAGLAHRGTSGGSMPFSESSFTVVPRSNNTDALIGLTEGVAIS